MYFQTFIILALSLKVYSEHVGAYSSPQYAKKMYPKVNFESNALLPKEKPAMFKRQEAMERRDDDSHGRSSLLSNAGNFLMGSGGRMMADLAKDYIARSTGSSQVGFDCISQVLSLNLTNLVILVLLKALILGAGFFGAGAWKGHGYARSLDDNRNASYITEDELLLYLSYLSGEQNKHYGCLYRLACQRPEQASLYSSSAEILLQGAKIMKGNDLELHHYEEIASGIRKAAEWGQNSMPCDTRYQCGQQ